MRRIAQIAAQRKAAGPAKSRDARNFSYILGIGCLFV